MKRALQLDDTLAEAHAAMGDLLFNTWPSAEHVAIAEREYHRALELNPNSARVLDSHSWLLWYFSWLYVSSPVLDASVTEEKRAHELDPLSVTINLDLAFRLIMDRQYDQAVELLQKTLELDPSNSDAHWDLGLAFMSQSRYEKALAELQEAIKQNPALPSTQLGVILHAKRTERINQVGVFLKSRLADQDTRL